MKVDEKLVDDLAHLSRLQFNPAEKETLIKDMEQILGFVEKLNELDTTGVEPLRHMTDTVNIMRADEINGSISREKALLNASDHDDQFFKVPKVIDK